MLLSVSFSGEYFVKGVRLDRVRGGRQKYRRVEGSTHTGIAVAYQMQQKKSGLKGNKILRIFDVST